MREWRNKNDFRENPRPRRQAVVVDPETLSRETSFTEDLNADSLDVVELSMTIEELFELREISEDDLKKISTLGDLVDYVEKASAN